MALYLGSNKVVKSNYKGGVDASGVTAMAGDVLSPKVIVDKNGVEHTGTILTKTSSDVTASGKTVTVPAGYYASPVDKSVSTATQAIPIISVDTSTGIITASATQLAGYVSTGTKSATPVELTTQAGTTITPSTSQQTAVASGVYTTGTVYVAPVPVYTGKSFSNGVYYQIIDIGITQMPSYIAAHRTKYIAPSSDDTNYCITDFIINNGVMLFTMINTHEYIHYNGSANESDGAYSLSMNGTELTISISSNFISNCLFYYTGNSDILGAYSDQDSIEFPINQFDYIIF